MIGEIPEGNRVVKALLIARVSTEDQRDALPAQVHRLKDYAERRGFSYELIEYQESAYKGNRDEFRGIITRIQSSKELVAVVFDKIDRYTRDSTAEEVRILQNLYRAGEIELHFPSDNLIIHRDSPATDIMRLGLGVVLAQYYSDAISDNVKRRLEQKLRDGEWIGQAPVGYKNVTRPDGKKWVEIDPATADVVKAAYEWYASGNYSLKLVRSKILAEFGYDVGTSQLDLILKNPFYKGVMLVKGKLYPHNYERIITESIFDQAKRVREGYHIKPVIYAGLPYPYRGLIRCAECDCRITFEKKKGLYVYGHCTQWKGKHGAAYVSEKSFTEQFQGMFESFAIPDDDLVAVSESFKADFEGDRRNKWAKLSQLEAEIGKYEKRSERVYEDYADEVISKELYLRKDSEYKKSIKALKRQMKNIELGSDEEITSVNRLLDLSNRAPTVFKDANPEEKRSLINYVISNLLLEGDLLRWKLKKPFDTMALCALSGNWLTTIGEVITAIKQDLALSL